jgi:hypothetical protein
MPERKQHKECSYIILTLTGLKRSSHKNILAIMDDSSYRLNFDLGKKNKIHHHSEKEHVKISKTAKFGREML